MTLFLRHSPIILMVVVTLWLIVGAAISGAVTAVAALVIFSLVMLAVYLALYVSADRLGLTRVVVTIAECLAVPPLARPAVLWALTTIPVAISLLHYLAFDGFTLDQALLAESVLEGALLRQSIGEIPSWMRYLSAFAVGSLFPIALLFAVVHKLRVLTIVIAVFGALYATNLMQKSGPIIIALPTIVYYVVMHRWWRLLISIAAVGATVFLMGFISNPQLQPAPMAQAFHALGGLLSGAERATTALEALRHASAATGASRPEVGSAKSTATLAQSLFDRVVVVPGMVVGQWFDLIPAQIPHGHGCGYRFLAPLLDCEFQNYSFSVYEQLYPEFTDQGLRGTVNAASMMTGYANFGIWGVLAYAVLQGAIAWGLFALFARDPLLSLPVNVVYILLLSSGELLTILLSGGWGLSVLIFLLVGRTQRSSPGDVVPHLDINAQTS